MCPSDLAAENRGLSVTSNLTHLTLPVKMAMRLASRAWLLPPSRPLLQQLRPWPRSCPSAFGPWPSATVTHSRRSSCWRWPRPAEMGSKHVETKKVHEKCNVTLSAEHYPDSICQTASAPQHHAAVLWSAAKLTNDRPLFAELAGLEIGIFC